MGEIATEEFIRQKFAEYYSEHSQSIQPPTSIDRREFGFILFKERIMVRHKGFKDVKEMRRFIESIVPSDAYYSAAYYGRPEEEMERKGWIGADLFFDIDADHLQTPCRTEHDYWICENCRNTGRGKRPARCPNCGGERLREEAWPCEKCLEAAKTEALKLVDFLLSDFGFQERDVDVYFSGHRGYHVHVEGG
ncbi:MAG: DNA primase small subunit domain-containing protein, partial [Candidatus Bathyarchaeia archaeon]